VIAAGITLPIVLFVPSLHRLAVSLATLLGGNVLLTTVVIAVGAGLGAIAVTALFRIIFNLLSNVL